MKTKKFRVEDVQTDKTIIREIEICDLEMLAAAMNAWSKLPELRNFEVAGYSLYKIPEGLPDDETST